MKKKIICIILITLLLMILCNYYRSRNPSTEIRIGRVTDRYLVDKFHIQQDYLYNIESSRLKELYMQDSIRYKTYALYNKYENPIGFGKYAVDWVQTIKLQSSPEYIYHNNKTYTNISVSVDTLYYRADSLVCAALVVVGYPNYYRPEKIEYTAFDGYLLLGCRDNINKKFDIYTYNNILIWKQKSKEGMSRDLKDEYCRNDRKKTLPYSVENEKFFTIPLLFGKTPEGDYNFQHNIMPWNSIDKKIGEKIDLYSNDKTRDFYLPEDTVFIPYKVNGI